MRAHSIPTRRLLASTVPVAFLLGLGVSPGHADPLIGNTLNSFGLPGGIDTPTAEMMPDATLGATVAYSNLTRKNSIVFQVLPRLGKLVAGDDASYRYLAESIRMHPGQEELKSLMQKNGFGHVDYHNMTGGIVALHVGIKC